MAIQDAGSISEEVFKGKAPYLIPTPADETDASCVAALLALNDVIEAHRNGHGMESFVRLEKRLAVEGDLADNKYAVACRRPELLLSCLLEHSGHEDRFVRRGRCPVRERS